MNEDYGIRVQGEGGDKDELFSSKYPSFMLDSQHEPSFKTISITFVTDPPAGTTIIHTYDTGYGEESSYTKPTLYFATVYVDSPPPSSSLYQQYTANGSVYFQGGGGAQYAQLYIQANTAGKINIYCNKSASPSLIGARVTFTIYTSVEEMAYVLGVD